MFTPEISSNQYMNTFNKGICKNLETIFKTLLGADRPKSLNCSLLPHFELEIRKFWRKEM